eukprot:CAMPEP_0198297100 /NCGR_PEP_ID=MMETSP1449-20131203/35404_1 /TAXON_ID=420275 /ORGANISM="Attheya septentrionalis, Strain CCMP2084" /LENGTH=688 /DNA_ID=CAMNT_0043997931 /DNA_START=157 /DNA_END=2223 /DNA_ORIENTATION=+
MELLQRRPAHFRRTLTRRRSTAISMVYMIAFSEHFSSAFTTAPSRVEPKFKVKDYKPNPTELWHQIYDQEPTQYLSTMPSWLLQKRGYLAGEKVASICTAMDRQGASFEEIERVLGAIRTASAGDRDKLADTADFLVIMVDIMEMGQQIDALVAGAYHYCSCVRTWEELVAAASSSVPRRIKFDEELHTAPLVEQKISETAIRLALEAARIHWTETVSSTVLNNPENLQSLLLSVTEDWRALAMRCAACLYKLRGIESKKKIENKMRIESLRRKRLAPEEANVARDALHVYAILAHRLGMHRLKSEIEGVAFRILYPRQYRAVASLYKRQRHIGCTVRDKMNSVLDDATSKMRQILDEDPVFRKHVKTLDVSARIKEPYSLWKKMLRKRGYFARNVCKRSIIERGVNILEIPDAIALRVIMGARKIYKDEDDEVTRNREKSLCYYVERLCKKTWSEKEPQMSVILGMEKDYIRFPKDNGYQSIHFNASMRKHGEDWPFEVQLRSTEMHRVAEYGLAAHWSYKADATGRYVGSTSDVNSGSRGDMMKVGGRHKSSSVYGHALESWRRSRISDEKQKRVGDEESSWKMHPYIKALAAARLDMAKDEVFVVLSPSSTSQEGRIVRLRAGSRVVDAMLEGERQYGRAHLRWRRQKKNGPLSSKEEDHSKVEGVIGDVTRKLKNGDVLVVPVS